jgi:hypothetical protein
MQSQHIEQQNSTAQLADSLLSQLGHLPSQLNSSGSAMAVSAGDPAQLPSTAAQNLQVSQQNRNDSTSDQYFYARSGAEHAVAVSQQLRSSGSFSMQFLEPPNSQVPSGQLLHPALVTHPSASRLHAGLSSEKTAALVSIPGNSSLIRPGAPMLNTIGVGWNVHHSMPGRLTCGAY